MASETFTVNIEARNTATQQLIAVRESLKGLQAQSAETSKAVKSTSETVKKFSQVSALSVPALGRMGEGFSRISDAINTVIPALDNANAAFRLARSTGASCTSAIVAGFEAMGTGIRAQLKSLTASMLANPFTAMVVAITAAIAGAAALCNYLKSVRVEAAKTGTELNRIGEKASRIFDDVITREELQSARKSAAAALEELNGELLDAVNEEEDELAEKILEKINRFRDEAYTAELKALDRVNKAEVQKRIDDLVTRNRAIIEAMEKRAVELRGELSKLRKKEAEELARVGAKGSFEKIQVELEFVSVRSRAALEAELKGLEEKDILGESELKRARELLAAKEKIAEIEKSQSEAARSLRQRIELMQAEIKSVEALADAKKKLYRQDLEAQFLAAGVQPEHIQANVDKYLKLEADLEQVRKERAEEAEKERMATRESASGNFAGINTGKALQVSNDSLNVQREQLKVQKDLVTAFRSFSRYKPFGEFKTVLN